MDLRNRIQSYIKELKQAYQAGVNAQAAEDIRWSEELLRTEHSRKIETWRRAEGTNYERELEGILRREALPSTEYSGGIKRFLFTMGKIKGDEIYKVPFIRYLSRGRVQ